MPNKPNPENVMVNFRLNRALRKKLDKLAEMQGIKITELLTSWIIKGTQNIELDPEDYEEIAQQIRAARAKR